ncbi:hypothetical protein [sulfur-oxidizing endosymbiont of Gigantopelta aegis]|uniref:hypothetical protein n=1 Tax=sulfur-oxidizing endosymbiont of Gigantopelta aegis TaxID=2794934 RepID=UPI0018DE70EB|nr:hypothetical protein [sulfur-oxidizing endosymbiont of Gigantopelta aegis]
MVCEERYARYKLEREKGFSAADAAKLSKSKPDYYVGPAGPEATLPTTGYRYMRYKNDDGTINRYAQQAMENKTAPSTYIGFDKFDTGEEARSAFQIKGITDNVEGLDDASWSDARLRGQFDTLQLYENGTPKIRIPNWAGDQDISKLEPVTKSYPEFGDGGVVQMHADGKFIEFDNIEVLPEK